ncbi:SPOC-domain-containing protein [Sodiomyces alkalinus F11]|uniref:Transcription factor BYE1 n=1 Tax=Sodiomyces alkalinus (strain CBS 110278 / VKM F-3762 / F11) TaxID=1314773 RepID=A0A3N2QB37_SODAK|nr:SPOC-domain-containing protein [Sodiomyces alkalinus F11]ROT43815.1 SPOC-domain-containing protein [Sodiomyces alkalinus F11]
MSEPEPRRSVRATKGQHTKAFDDQPLEPPKKRGRKKKQREQEPEEVIRCVCGATEQDGESEEPWIACDKCGAWQHNVCMGMSVFTEDLPKHYYCEKCSPQDHKELLAAIARGEHPWEERRKKYEESLAEKKKKRKKPGRPAKVSHETKDDASQSGSVKGDESPAPESSGKQKEKQVKKETGKPGATGKRKSQDDAERDVKGPAQKIRKISDVEPRRVDYAPPSDLPAKIADIPNSATQTTAHAIQRSIAVGFAAAIKNKLVTLPKDVSAAEKSEEWAIQIERAVRDTHPDPNQYAVRCRALVANLKTNAELSVRLFKSTLTPPMLAVMTTDQLATKEQQRLNAELRAKSEKQSILVTEEGPRVRRTHKGEELVEDEDDNNQVEESESGPTIIRQPSGRDDETDSARSAQQGQQQQQQQQQHQGQQRQTSVEQNSPRQHTDFDINKVFSSVKSPAAGGERRASAQVGRGHSDAPTVDADVDRLLQDDTDSPPYSPTEETDPDVVWRGSMAMNTIADFQATARWAAGANLSNTIHLPWYKLIPKRMTVAGRIDEQKAIEYLCGLRYADNTDVVVVSLSPASEDGRPDFLRLFDYFTSKKRYAVVGDKGVGNVRDTYLVPVPAGEGGMPEFLLNFADNLVPHKRTEPILLAVFVYRNATPLEARRSVSTPSSSVANTPTPTSAAAAAASAAAPAGYASRHTSVSGPAFSPTVAQSPHQQQQQQQQQQQYSPASFPPTQNGHPTQGAHQVVPPNQPPHGYAARPTATQDEDFQRRRDLGENIAREVLGPFINCPTVQFLLPQAYQMTRREWEVCRSIYERDPRARDDLKHLSNLLQMEGNNASATSNPPSASPQQAAAPST